MNSPSGGKRGSNYGVASLLVLASLLVFSNPKAVSADELRSGVANYSIAVRLDPEMHTLDAHEVLSWHNLSGEGTSELYFHLYPNAFKSGSTTFMTETGRNIPSSAYGWMDVTSFVDLRTGENLTAQIRYSSPDDGNTHDSTVIVVKLSRPVAPGDSIAVSIDFNEQLPQAVFRGGYVPGRNFYMISQWFPKIGVYHDGVWNCHQYHAFTQFFSDFGEYNVKITVPAGYVVGATGEEVDRKSDADGMTTYRWVAADVRDFAWTASPDFIRVRRVFKGTGLPETKVVLLLRPEHRAEAGRYFSAVDTAMNYFGSWYGSYPYSVLTVVDPPPESGLGNMELPAIFTARRSDKCREFDFSLEARITREIGHQYWYCIVGSDGFEEAWLDQGLTSYSAGEVMEKSDGGQVPAYSFGGDYTLNLLPVVSVDGIPAAAIIGKTRIHEPFNSIPLYLKYATADAISDYAYRARNRGAYEAIASDKADLVLHTLEGVVGRSAMLEIMRNYFEEYRFGHPTAADFRTVAERIAGRDLGWFFNSFISGTGTVDFAVSSIEYYRETDLAIGTTTYVTSVTVKRNGEVKMPVDLRLSLEDGTSVDTLWDGQARWHTVVLRTNSLPKYAVLDPEGKIPLDIDYANNSLLVRPSYLPVIKWVARVFNYFQHVLLVMGLLA